MSLDLVTTVFWLTGAAIWCVIAILAFWLFMELLIAVVDACIPDLSAHDYEVVDHIAHWLGSQDGQAFIAGCQAEIERRRKLDQLAEYHSRGMSHLPIVRQLESELAAC